MQLKTKLAKILIKPLIIRLIRLEFEWANPGLTIDWSMMSHKDILNKFKGKGTIPKYRSQTWAELRSQHEKSRNKIHS